MENIQQCNQNTDNKMTQEVGVDIDQQKVEQNLCTKNDLNESIIQNAEQALFVNSVQEEQEQDFSKNHNEGLAPFEKRQDDDRLDNTSKQHQMDQPIVIDSMSPCITKTQQTPKGPLISKNLITIVKKQRPNNNGRRLSAGSQFSANRSVLSSAQAHGQAGATEQKHLGFSPPQAAPHDFSQHSDETIMQSLAVEEARQQQFTINETQIEVFLPYTIEQNLFPHDANLIETRKKRRQSRKPNRLNDEEIIFTQFETSCTANNNHPPMSRNPMQMNSQQQQLSVVKDQYSAEQAFAERGSTGRHTPMLKTPPLPNHHHGGSSIITEKSVQDGVTPAKSSTMNTKVIVGSSAGRAPRPQSKRISSSSQINANGNKAINKSSANSNSKNNNNLIISPATAGADDIAIPAAHHPLNQALSAQQQLPPTVPINNQSQTQQNQLQQQSAAQSNNQDKPPRQQHVRQLTSTSSVFESQLLESQTTPVVELATDSAKLASDQAPVAENNHNVDGQSATNMSEFLVTFPTYNQNQMNGIGENNSTVSVDQNNMVQNQQFNQRTTLNGCSSEDFNVSNSNNGSNLVKQKPLLIQHHQQQQLQHRHTLMIQPTLQLANTHNSQSIQQASSTQQKFSQRNSCELRVTIQLEPSVQPILNHRQSEQIQLLSTTNQQQQTPQPQSSSQFPTNITVPTSHPFSGPTNQPIAEAIAPPDHQEHPITKKPTTKHSKNNTKQTGNQQSKKASHLAERKTLNFAENLNKLMLSSNVSEKLMAKKTLTRICSDQNLLTRMSRESNILSNNCTKENGKTLTRGLKRQETLSSNFESSGHTPKPEVDSAALCSIQKSENRKIYQSQHGTRERLSQGSLHHHDQQQASARTLSRQKVNSQQSQYNLSKNKVIVSQMSRTAHKPSESNNGKRGVLGERRDKILQPLQIIDELVRLQSQSSRQIAKSHREMKAQSPQQSLNSRQSLPNQKSPPIQETFSKVITKLIKSKSNKRRRQLMQTTNIKNNTNLQTTTKQKSAKRTQDSTLKIKSNASEENNRSEKQTTSKKTLKPAAQSSLNFSEEALFKLIKAINCGSDAAPTVMQLTQPQISPRMQSPGPHHARNQQSNQPFTYRKSATFKLSTNSTQNSQAILAQEQHGRQVNLQTSCTTSIKQQPNTRQPNRDDSNCTTKQKSWDNVVMAQSKGQSPQLRHQNNGKSKQQFAHHPPQFLSSGNLASAANFGCKKQKQPTQGCASNGILTGQSKNGSSDPASAHTPHNQFQQTTSQHLLPHSSLVDQLPPHGSSMIHQTSTKKRQQQQYKIRNGGRNSSLPSTSAIPSEHHQAHVQLPRTQAHHRHQQSGTTSSQAILASVSASMAAERQLSQPHPNATASVSSNSILYSNLQQQQQDNSLQVLPPLSNHGAIADSGSYDLQQQQTSLMHQHYQNTGTVTAPNNQHNQQQNQLNGSVESAYQTGQRHHVQQQNQNNQTTQQQSNHNLYHQQQQNYVRQLSDRSHQPQSKRGPLLDNRSTTGAAGGPGGVSKGLQKQSKQMMNLPQNQQLYLKKRGVAQGAVNSGYMVTGDASQNHQQSKAGATRTNTASGVNSGGNVSKRLSSNLMLIPTSAIHQDSISGSNGGYTMHPRQQQDLARHTLTSSTFSQISSSSKSKPLNRAGDTLHQKLLKKTEKYGASMEKTMLRSSMPHNSQQQLNQQSFSQSTLNNNNHRRIISTLKNAAFLSPKAGGGSRQQVTSSGGLTFTSQADSLALKAALSSQKKTQQRENRVNSNIAMSSTVSNLMNPASSSTMIDFHNNASKAQAQAFSPQATRSQYNNVQLRQANPYKSNHAKRILEEHYNIKTLACGSNGKGDNELQNGPPVFKLTKNHTSGQTLGFQQQQHVQQRPQTSYILKNNGSSNQKPKMLLRQKATAAPSQNTVQPGVDSGGPASSTTLQQQHNHAATTTANNLSLSGSSQQQLQNCSTSMPVLGGPSQMQASQQAPALLVPPTIDFMKANNFR